MIIGIPKEIKAQENRVAAIPPSVALFTAAGHTVLVQRGAGEGSGFSDGEYLSAGARVVDTAAEVYASADMIYKVKEPLEPEYGLLREGQIVFAYLHLAPDPAQTKALMDAKVSGVAFETVQLANGSLPLLAPMSEVAGRLAPQIGASLLQKINNGSGILLGGVPGVAPGHVVIVGAGTVGTGAARIAAGLGARVTVLDVSVERLARIEELLAGQVETLMSNSQNIAASVTHADLLVGAVLVAGAKAPVLVTEEMVKTMRQGSVIVDIAIDQGGIAETIDHATSHQDPYYIRHGVVHYSVPNIPGAVPRTSTLALSNATTPYALKIADKGLEQAMREDPALFKGLNTYKGRIACAAVAAAQDLAYEPAALT
ncbi:MAG: alanine dehydrogenase [Oscillospiraceae bacterium]|jgi:alanine dehydrogenase|nr:alanine dehydrogenase [Oscillospiraceae bacterium]